MGLSSCLCQPRSVSFSHLVEKIDSINTHFYTLQQAPPDSGVLLKETLVKELLGDIFYHRKEVQNREVRLVGVSQPYTQVLACAFNIKSIGFEWKTNEIFLVTYGHDGKIADALYLGINEITPTFIKFSFNSKRHIPTEDIQRSKWVYNEQSNLLKLEVFEENSWLDEDKNPCLDNYYKFLILNIEYDVDSEIALKCIAKDINDGTLSSLALEQFIKTTCVDGCDNVRKIISNYISTMNVNSDIISKTNTAIINNNASNPYITKKLLNMSSYNKNKTQQSLKNDKKFSFIICSNNKQYETECIRYINALNIPDGYSIEIIVVHNARSMTSGYNAAMLSSDAKYKIYLHHDTFIINKNILFDILEQFKYSSVGMIGVV